MVVDWGGRLAATLLSLIFDKALRHIPLIEYAYWLQYVAADDGFLSTNFG
tara:strand:- start:1531 stop:1680 length:150 start_codon:yes stop_codon:yes gene_type:complete